MSRNRTPQKKPAKPQSDTNRDRRARRGEKQAAPKPTPAPQPVSPPPVPSDVAELLPSFARELISVAPPPTPPETQQDSGHGFPGRPLPEGDLFRVHREVLDKLDPENPAHAAWFSPRTVEDAAPALPPTDQAVEALLEQLGRPATQNRAGLPADHPAHRLSTAQWVRLQVTLELMGRGENAWRAAREAVDHSDLLDRITWHILACEEGPDLRRQTFGEPE